MMPACTTFLKMQYSSTAQVLDVNWIALCLAPPPAMHARARSRDQQRWWPPAPGRTGPVAQLERVQPLTGPVLCAWNAGGAWFKTRQDYTVQVLQAVARRCKALTFAPCNRVSLIDLNPNNQRTRTPMRTLPVSKLVPAPTHGQGYSRRGLVRRTGRLHRQS